MSLASYIQMREEYLDETESSADAWLQSRIAARGVSSANELPQEDIDSYIKKVNDNRGGARNLSKSKVKLGVPGPKFQALKLKDDEADQVSKNPVLHAMRKVAPGEPNEHSNYRKRILGLGIHAASSNRPGKNPGFTRGMNASQLKNMASSDSDASGPGLDALKHWVHKASEALLTLVNNGYGLEEACQIVYDRLNTNQISEAYSVLHEALSDIGIGRYTARKVLAEALG